MKYLNIFATLGLLMFFTFNQSATAQEDLLKSEYSCRRYTTQDGLPNMQLNTLHKDNNGFIWIGTLRGLARFDGFTFTNYLSESVNNVNYIRSYGKSIKAYGAQNVYIPCENDSVIKIKIVPDSLYIPESNSQHLPDGYFICRSRSSINRYLMKEKGDTLIEILRHPKLSMLGYNSVFLDEQTSKLYFSAYTGDELYIYDMQNQKLTVHNMKTAESFFKHSTLGILAFTREGIYKVSEKQVEKYIDIQLGGYKKAIELKDGSIIFKDQSKIFKLQNGKLEKYAQDLSVYFIDMLLDNEENLWLVTSNGLINYFRFEFKNISVNKGYPGTFLEDGDGNSWIGTSFRELYRYNAKDTLKIDCSKFYDMGMFFSGSCNAYGSLYFPRRSGVMIYSNNKLSDAGLPFGQYYSKVIPIKNEQILVQAYNGIYQCNSKGDVINFFDSEEKLHQMEIYDTDVDRDNRWIIAGGNGITIVKDSTFHLIKPSKETMQTIVCSDSNGNIWSANSNSLDLVQGDSITSIHCFDKEAIQAIIPHTDDYLIITTMKAVYIFNKNSFFNFGKKEILRYDHLCGMTGIEPQAFGLHKDSKGDVYIETKENIVSFNPNQLIRKNTAPILSIQKCLVSNNNVNWTNIKEADKNIFHHKHKNIRFQFIGLKYSNTNHIRYHYRLVGFQNDWGEPTKNREVTFNNLPPGDYIFEIYADAGTDESRSEIQSFVFSIKPAFWQTAWFLVASIAFLMLASAGIALNVQRRKNKILLEKLRAEKELNELRISSIRLKAIPHFNANVLSAIEYYIANRTKEEAMRILGIYSDFTLKTLSEVNRASRPISEELAYVKMYLDLEKIRFLEKFDFQINVEDKVDESVQLPNMMLHTYCENAVKHGLMPLKSGGLLTINVSQRDQIVFVSVEDNGVGRASAAQNPHLHSSKQGLSILNRQIEIYNSFNRGKINSQVEDLLKDEKPSGTRFTVEVPIDFEYVN